MVWRQLRQSRLRSVLPGLTGSVSLRSGQGAGRGTHRITPTAQSFPQTMIFHWRRRWQTRMRYSPFTPRGLFSTSMWSRSLRIGERQGMWSFMGSRSIRFLTVRCAHLYDLPVLRLPARQTEGVSQMRRPSRYLQQDRRILQAGP